MGLTADQRKRLLAALNDVFTAADAVEELAQGASSRTLAQISLANNLPAILSDMVDKARDEGWIGSLLDEAIALRPASADLGRLRDELRDEVAVTERIDPFTACRLEGHNYMVDRIPLRDKLCRLFSEDEGMHILRVSGPSKSGKSHTFQLVRHLATVRQLKLVFVDLADLSGSVGRDLLPEDLADEIVLQMRLDGQMPERQNELDSRWVRRFVAWLTGELQGQDGKYWIVLDSFDGTLVAAGVYELVQRLAEQIEINLGQMRLILLGYDRDLPDRVLNGLEEDDLAAMGRIGQEQLLRFFGSMYQERTLRRNLEFAPADIAASVSTVMQQVDFDRDDYLLLLGRAVIEEGKRIWNLGSGT